MREIKKLQNLPPRNAGDHKGSLGRVLIVACSPGMTGAGCLAALGAQRAGAGLITLALPNSLALVGEIFRPSIMSRGLPDNRNGVLSLEAAPEVEEMAKKADVCAVGPGLGMSDETAEAVRLWTRRLEIPLVLDADALNILARSRADLKAREAPAVITPHPGEMARLCGLESAREVQRERIGIASDFAREYGVVTVLKGNRTVVADGQRSYENQTGNPGMATGGMGDVLTGIVAGLIGGGMKCFEAACLGVYVHGLAGDRAAEQLSMTSLAPEDLLETLPKVFLDLEKRPFEFDPV